MNVHRTLLLVWAAACFAALGGVRPAAAQLAPPPADTLAVPADTPLDPDAPPDLNNLFSPPAAAPPVGQAPPERNGRLEHPVQFTATDSLVITFDAVGDVGTLYGDARASYDDATLTAHEIDLLFDQETLRARGFPSDTALAGRPAFQRGNEGFTGRELAFNLATGRGRIVGARTAIEDGYLAGGIIKQAGPRVTFAEDVVYTTCDLEDHQHWGLHTHRLKVVDGEWIYTGPAQLHLLGIPTPLWLPFGFFPAAAEGRRSGPLPPDYGEQTDLGFYLRNLGFYWALSEYMDLQLRGGVFTSGSYELDGNWRYARRYAYDGGLSIGFRSERRGEVQDPGFRTNREASVTWRHNQTFDAAGTARLTGNVNLRSSGYSISAAEAFEDRVSQHTTSRVNYTKRWRNGRNLSAAYSQTLSLSDGSTNLTLPSLSFNQPRWFPFRAEGSRGRRWYEQIGVQYTGSFDNRYSFRPLADTLRQDFVPPDPLRPGAAGASPISWLDGLLSYEDYRTATGETERFQASARHQIPISGRVAIRRLPLVGAVQLDLNPSLNYSEDWHFSRNVPRIHEDGTAVRDQAGRVQFITESAFNPVRQATFNVSASTQAFGTFPWQIGAFDGFRHALRPTATFSLAPDYRGEFWGRRLTYTEPDGTVIEYPSRPGLTLTGREQRTLSLSLNNTLQGRIVSEDAAGAVQRRIVQLLSLDANTGYDFAADSLRWRQVNLSARSTIADQVNLSLSAVYSPYVVDGTGRTRNQLYFTESGFPLRFTRANFSATTSLRGRQDARGAEVAAPRYRSPHDALIPHDYNGLAPYDYRRPDLGFVDFAIPWQLALDFNYGVTRNFLPTGTDQRIATLGSTFDLGLTPSWRLSGRSGFDFVRGEVTPTQLSVLRDLHCWEMSLTVIPFGRVRAFNFSIYVRSGQLRDLLRLNVPNVDRTRYF